MLSRAALKTGRKSNAVFCPRTCPTYAAERGDSWICRKERVGYGKSPLLHRDRAMWYGGTSSSSNWSLDFMFIMSVCDGLFIMVGSRSAISPLRAQAPLFHKPHFTTVRQIWPYMNYCDTNLQVTAAFHKTLSLPSSLPKRYPCVVR